MSILPFQVEATTQLTCIEVDFCIEEWSTGLLIKKSSFDEVENLSRYIDHFLTLKEWRSLSPAVVDKILQKKYDRMRFVHHLSSAYMCSQLHGSHRMSFGIVLAEYAPTKMTSAVREAATSMNELEGRTGDTDSELEQ